MKPKYKVGDIFTINAFPSDKALVLDIKKSQYTYKFISHEDTELVGKTLTAAIAIVETCTVLDEKMTSHYLRDIKFNDEVRTLLCS